LKFTVTIAAREHEVVFDEAYGKRTLAVDGSDHRLTLLRVQGERVRFTVDDHPVEAIITGTPPDLMVDVGHGPMSLKVEETRFAQVRKISGLAQVAKAIADLKAPMPGLVTKVLVSAGDTVTTGTPLLVMEAMKMENELRAQGDGTVADVKITPGQPVDQGQVLVTFRTDREADSQSAA
jgi:biotin carboxyl carrier protein